MSDIQEIESLLTQTKGLVPEAPGEIPLTLISARDGGFAKRVIAPVDAATNAFSLHNQTPYPIRFFEPVYIQKVVVKLSSDSSSGLRKLKFTYLDSFNSKKEGTLKENSEGLECDIKEIIKEIAFESFKKFGDFGNKVKIRELVLYGCTQEEILELSKSVDKAISLKLNLDTVVSKQIEKIKIENQALDKRKAEIDQLISQKNEELVAIKNKFEASEIELSSLSAELAKLKIERNGITSELSIANDKLTALKNDQINAENNVQKLQGDGKDLVEKNRKLSLDLKTLQRESSLFTEDIQGYARRINRDILTYAVLALIPLIVLAGVTWNLYHGAQNILSFYTDFPASDRPPIMDLLLSRLPYTLIAVIIIEVCFRICMNFVNKVIDLNRDRLNLSRVSIIARDVSDSVFSALKIESDDEIKFHLATKFKMDLLKAHLSKDVGNEYSHDPLVQVELSKRPMLLEAMEKIFGAKKPDGKK